MKSNMDMLNTSGFPFQMRIADEIKPEGHQWEVFAQEHAWKYADSNEYGFIDIIAGYGSVRLVIECKRAADSRWLFISEKSTQGNIDRAHVLFTDHEPGEPSIKVWGKARVLPKSPISKFCIVRGQTDKEPMIERICTNLLLSTEALADEEIDIDKKIKFGGYKFLIPVIITTADMSVCNLDTKDVSLQDGKIDKDNYDFEQAKILRFTKKL